jgi:hypothetical protein
MEYGIYQIIATVGMALYTLFGVIVSWDYTKK